MEPLKSQTKIGFLLNCKFQFISQIRCMIHNFTKAKSPILSTESAFVQRVQKKIIALNFALLWWSIFKHNIIYCWKLSEHKNLLIIIIATKCLLLCCREVEQLCNYEFALQDSKVLLLSWFSMLKRIIFKSSLLHFDSYIF